jgi:hypothetical protein|tara:strand:- start:421 stop:558 length:138 start_codon:yes stop_codon:yes gene_type:complete
MKKRKEIRDEIKKAHQNMLNSSNSMFAYWLGFKRALEWLFLEDKK